MIPENPATPIYELVIDARSNASDSDPFGAVQRASVPMGDAVTLRCRALFNTTSDKSSIIWGFRGNTLHPSIGNSYLHIEDDRLTSTLEIGQFQKKHQGSFECFLSVNDSITAIAAIHLSPKFDSKPNMSSSELEECASDLFTCLNGGTCYKHVKTGQMFCRCFPDFGGPHCEHYMPRIVNGAAAHNCVTGNMDMSACLLVGALLGLIIILLFGFLCYVLKRKNLIRDGILQPMRKGMSEASFSSSEYFKTSLRRRTSHRLTECTCTPSEENLSIMEKWPLPEPALSMCIPTFLNCNSPPVPDSLSPSTMDQVQNFIFHPKEFQCVLQQSPTNTEITAKFPRSTFTQPLINTTLVVTKYLTGIPTSTDFVNSLDDYQSPQLTPTNTASPNQFEKTPPSNVQNFGVLRVATDRRLTFSERSHKNSECTLSVTSSIDCC